MTDLLAVGSYTEPYGAFRARGEGLTLLDFDRHTGTLTLLGRLDMPNPAYLRPFSATALHLVYEVTDERAAIACVTVAPDLRLHSQAPIPGAAPCHLDVHPSGRWAACACYGSGDVLTYPIGADGSVGSRAGHARHIGRSIHPERQAGPHPHAVRWSSDGRWLFVADLGTDEVRYYRFDAATGAIEPAGCWAAPPGSGPRLLLFAPDQKHVLLVLELANAVACLRWDGDTLTSMTTSPSLIAAHQGPSTAAGLRWHPSGEIFAVSTRGADRVTLFRFSSGAIVPTAETSSGGAKPRDFTFSPCGQWLIAANQDGDSLAVFSVDAAAGSLTDTGQRAVVRSPSCVRFMPQ